MRWINPLRRPTTGEILQGIEEVNIYPAKCFVTPKDRLDSAFGAIRSVLGERLESQRLEQRTKHDLEMLGQVGYCNGVENYARHLAGRQEGTPPECLIDYFPDDWLLIVDESEAIYKGSQEGVDRARLPPAQRCRQPAAQGGGVLVEGPPDRVRFSHPEELGDRGERR